MGGRKKIACCRSYKKKSEINIYYLKIFRRYCYEKCKTVDVFPHVRFGVSEIWFGRTARA